jgi:streptomycin 6-kinase
VTDAIGTIGRTLAEIVDSRTFAPVGDPAGRIWFSSLPLLIEEVCRNWRLEFDGDRVFHGYNAIVVLARREGLPLALKFVWPPEAASKEADALEMWHGRAMVQMADVHKELGVLLLERLDPDRTLRSLGPPRAAAAAGLLIRRLAIPPPEGLRSLRVLIADSGRAMVEAQQRLGNPVPERWMDEAIEISKYFRDHAGTDQLIHADLHYDNILAGSREPWLAIDPRPVAGEPEASVPPLMWTREDYMESDEEIRGMLAVLAAAGDLDRERTRQWAIVRCVDYLLWGLEHGLTHDPVRCRRILEALA